MLLGTWSKVKGASKQPPVHRLVFGLYGYSDGTDSVLSEQHEFCFVGIGFALLQEGEEVDAAAVKQPIEKATLGERVAFLGVVGDWGNPLWIVVMGFEKVLESTDESRVSMGRTHR